MSPNRKPLQESARGLRPAAACIDLDAIAGRARALDALDDRLRHLLPAAVARETRLGDIRNGRLVFLASSPTWASRLRLYQAILMAEACAALGGTVERFAVKVAPLPTVPPEPAKLKPLSSASAQHIRAAANATQDPELKALYLDLASLAEQ